MRLIARFGTLVILFLLVGCQTPSQRARSEINAAVLQDSIENPRGYRRIDGLEVWLPEGTGLKIYDQRREYLLLGKKTGSGTSVAALLELLTTSRIDADSPDQFVEYVRSNLSREYRKKGDILASSTGWTNALGQYCAQSHIRMRVNENNE